MEVSLIHTFLFTVIFVMMMSSISINTCANIIQVVAITIVIMVTGATVDTSVVGLVEFVELALRIICSVESAMNLICEKVKNALRL